MDSLQSLFCIKVSEYWEQLTSREEVWRWSQTATQSYQTTFVCVIIIREISQLVRGPSPWSITSVRLHPVWAKSRYSVSGGRSWSPSTAASWSSVWRRVWTLGSTPARSAPSTSPSSPTTSTSEVRTARRSWTGTMFWDSVCFTAFCSSGRANKVSTQHSVLCTAAKNTYLGWLQCKHVKTCLVCSGKTFSGKC